jgi:hypothetical protein
MIIGFSALAGFVFGIAIGRDDTLETMFWGLIPLGIAIMGARQFNARLDSFFSRQPPDPPDTGPRLVGDDKD